MKRNPPVFTNLGMHFLQVSADKIVLVQVEVNVRGLIAVHARRLCKSKRGLACVSSGTVRMSLATPDCKEAATVVALQAVEKDDEIERLHCELTRLRAEVQECGHTVECAINECNRARAERDELKVQISKLELAIPK